MSAPGNKQQHVIYQLPVFLWLLFVFHAHRCLIRSKANLKCLIWFLVLKDSNQIGRHHCTCIYFLMVWITYANKKQEAAFVSLIRVDNFNADVVIVTSVKASADEYTHYSEQDINWSLLDDIMTSEDLKDVSL